jgi:DNA polymerase-1
MKQLTSLHKQFPEHFRIISWDRGYTRRKAESEEGVSQGIVPESYKAAREQKKEDGDAETQAKMEELREQMGQLEVLLKLVRCIQVEREGVEGDDILHSYARTYLKWDAESVIVSSDQDFYQCIDKGISIYDAMKKETWNLERFETEFEFHPSLWVDVGAIQGEVGPSKDNIFGVDGWGPVNAVKYVRQYGDVDAIIEGLKAKKKRGKKEETFLNSIPRLRLAKSLKRMDIIPQLPKPRVMVPLTKEALETKFLEFGFASLLKEIWRLI